jgi:hypothetical protein
LQSLHLLIIDTHSRQRIKVFNFSSVLTACALAVTFPNASRYRRRRRRPPASAVSGRLR